jgi:hypothetical protein
MPRDDASGVDLVRAFVFDRRVQVQSEFDSLHQENINGVVADIGRTYSLFVMGMLNGDRLPQPGSRYDGFALLNEGLSLLVSGLNLARQRARIDAMAVLRVAVEAACVAIHIVCDSDAYEQYAGRTGKKYDSGKAISFAKPHVHRVGEFWGALSHAAIHPNRIIFGPRVADDGSHSISIGMPSANPEQDAFSLTMVSIASLMVFRAAEIALFEPDPLHPGMLQFVGTNLSTWPSGDRVLQERFTQMDQLIAADDSA